jgi:D-lyxose ketol-isomerase
MEVILMENLILILDDGFEITSYSKKYLSKIGALLFLHYNDYLTQKKYNQLYKRSSTRYPE